MVVSMVAEMPSGAAPCGLIVRSGDGEYRFIGLKTFGTDWRRLLKALSDAEAGREGTLQ